MKLCLTIILSILLGAGNVYAETVAVKTNQAEIRNGPSSGSFVITLAPLYYPLIIRTEREGFYQVSDYLNKIGWISKANIDRIRTVIVKTESANVRQGPGTNNPVVFRAKEGVTFKIINEDGQWLQVEHESGMTGWVHGDLVWGG
jgi:SH3-like domain-containing protein